MSTPAPGSSEPPDEPHPHVQRLVDALLELNCVLQMAHDRLEEMRDLARRAGHQADCVNLMIRLDDLREGVNQFKNALVSQSND